MVLMTILFFQMFKSVNWPLHLTAWYCLLRVAFLAIHLSISPNLPRLVFKISWDIALYTMIGVMIVALIGIGKYTNLGQYDSSDSVESS